MKRILFLLCLCVTVVSCEKWEDKPAPEDDRLDRPYCNDPEAVNYNWDFPGKPDNTTCFYPYELFTGRYIFTDSLHFSEDFLFGSVTKREIIIEQLNGSKSKLTIKGLCESGAYITLTADRFYKAFADSTLLPDSTMLPGQVFCRPTDTLSGFIRSIPGDTQRVQINLTVFTDTNVIYHIGTAIKQ